MKDHRSAKFVLEFYRGPQSKKEVENHCSRQTYTMKDTAQPRSALSLPSKTFLPAIVMQKHRVIFSCSGPFGFPLNGLVWAFGHFFRFGSKMYVGFLESGFPGAVVGGRMMWCEHKIREQESVDSYSQLRHV